MDTGTTTGTGTRNTALTALTALLAAGCLAAPLALAGCSDDSSGDAGASSTGAAPATVTQTVTDGAGTGGTGGTQHPAVTVNTDGLDPGRITASSVQAWADDVAAGDPAEIASKCWTVAPGYVLSHYTDVSARIAQSMTTTPVQAQDGYVWGSGSGAEVRVPWAEGTSEYACPTVVLDGNSRPDDDVVVYTAERFLLRGQGSPVNPGDTEDAYPLRCGYTQNPVDEDAVKAADAGNLRVTGRDEGGWMLTTTGAGVDMRIENGRVCVAGVTAA